MRAVNDWEHLAAGEKTPSKSTHQKSILRSMTGASDWTNPITCNEYTTSISVDQPELIETFDLIDWLKLFFLTLSFFLGT